jgi:hypothetical protein
MNIAATTYLFIAYLAPTVSCVVEKWAKQELTDIEDSRRTTHFVTVSGTHVEHITSECKSIT